MNGFVLLVKVPGEMKSPPNPGIPGLGVKAKLYKQEIKFMDIDLITEFQKKKMRA